MSGAAGRRKGHGWERELARMFRDIFPSAKRGLQFQDGNIVPDVVIPFFWLEAKVGKKPNPRAALLQACRDCSRAESDKWPIAVIKDSGTPGDAFVCMRLAHFMEMVISAEGGGMP